MPLDSRKTRCPECDLAYDLANQMARHNDWLVHLKTHMVPSKQIGIDWVESRPVKIVASCYHVASTWTRFRALGCHGLLCNLMSFSLEREKESEGWASCVALSSTGSCKNNLLTHHDSTTTSENAWWRPERYEASFSSRCDTVNLILQWPMQFQKLFVSLLPPVPGAESIVTRVWQCTTYQAKDSCWVQWCRLPESHCGHFHQSSVHLQTDQFVIFPHLTARWLPSSLKHNRVS